MFLQEITELTERGKKLHPPFPLFPPVKMSAWGSEEILTGDNRVNREGERNYILRSLCFLLLE